MPNRWVDEFPGAVTICDLEGIILEMNERAIQTFAGDGGKDLIGTNLLACHPEHVRPKIETLLQTQQKNVYSIEKNGGRKLIYQAPWYEAGICRGFVELSLEIPEDIPHFVRK